MRHVGLLLAGLLACGDKADDTASQAPDVTGRYQAFVVGTDGCGGDESWVDDWATGPLLISGTANALTFDFYEDMTFSGRVDDLGGFSFSGDVSWSGRDLTVINQGDFSLEDGAWLMEGTFEIVVHDPEFTTEDCTLTAPMRATELQGNEGG